MPPIGVYHKSEKATLKTAGEKESSHKEDDQTSNAERFSGILKIKNPRIIEEIGACPKRVDDDWTEMFPNYD